MIHNIPENLNFHMPYVVCLGSQTTQLLSVPKQITPQYAHPYLLSHLIKSLKTVSCIFFCAHRRRKLLGTNLTFTSPCITNIFSQYNQHDATFHNLCISVRRSTCVRPLLLPAWRLAAGSSNNIIIIIIIFIYCNWVVTRWQWLFYMYTKHKIG